MGNPLSRKEIKFSDYRKVPFVRSAGQQINDSSLIISVLRSHMLGKGDVSTLLTYYPFLEEDGAKGKGKYQNMYYIMYQEGFTEKQNLALREETKWRKWVDETFVHTLSPNIYRTMKESFQAMEYITKVGNFTKWDNISVLLRSSCDVCYRQEIEMEVQVRQRCSYQFIWGSNKVGP